MDPKMIEVHKTIHEAKEYMRKKFYEEQKRKEIKDEESATGQVVQDTRV